MSLKIDRWGTLLVMVLIVCGLSLRLRADADGAEDILQQEMTKVHDVLIKAIDDTSDANDKIKLLQQATDMIKSTSYTGGAVGPKRSKSIDLIHKAISLLKQGDPDNHATVFMRAAVDEITR